MQVFNNYKKKYEHIYIKTEIKCFLKDKSFDFIQVFTLLLHFLYCK